VARSAGDFDGTRVVNFVTIKGRFYHKRGKGQKESNKFHSSHATLGLCLCGGLRLLTNEG
jgi:hypothetical protein